MRRCAETRGGMAEKPVPPALTIHYVQGAVCISVVVVVGIVVRVRGKDMEGGATEV